MIDINNIKLTNQYMFYKNESNKYRLSLVPYYGYCTSECRLVLMSSVEILVFYRGSLYKRTFNRTKKNIPKKLETTIKQLIEYYEDAVIVPRILNQSLEAKYVNWLN